MIDLDEILGALYEEDNSALSAMALREKLNWSDDRFARALDDAISNSQVKKGPGGGGGVIALTDLGEDLIKFILAIGDADGERCGNTALRRDLGWPETRYLTVHSHALDIGRIARARGRGGSVRLISKDESLDEHLQVFLDTLKHEFEGYTGNIALRAALEWDEERYWTVRDLGLSRDLIVRGRGRGGTVSLVVDESDGQISQSRVPERELYDPALRTIESSWIEQFNYDDYVAKVTAHRGRASTGGTWTRPDISVLAITSYRFPPKREFEIITFEIKPVDAISILGVYEALSHKQFAHRSYVLYQYTGTDDGEKVGFVDLPEGMRILNAARKYGVGVILATDMENSETWDFVIEPEYSLPDPEQSDLFVSTCFDDHDHNLVGSWFV